MSAGSVVQKPYRQPYALTGKRAKMGANDLWSGQRSEVKHFLKFRTGYPLRTLPVRRCLLGAKRGFGWFLPLLREPANPDASRAKRICVPADTHNTWTAYV